MAGDEVALRDGADGRLREELRAMASRHDSARVEESRGRFFVYGSALEPLRHRVAETMPVAEMLLRRATLEDVFLLLTGRGLRD